MKPGKLFNEIQNTDPKDAREYLKARDQEVKPKPAPVNTVSHETCSQAEFDAIFKEATNDKQGDRYGSR